MTADLKAKLREALRQPIRADPAPRIESVTELTDLSSLGGRWFQSSHGPGYVIESVYEGAHEHGSIPLHRALTVEPSRLAGQVRDPRLSDVTPDRFLYVDTETTGLGGAGVMVFLAGAARFEGATLRLKQYLLPSPAYEGGLLGGLGADLAEAGALVSYNGKSFDLPMLETRAILSRLPSAFRGLPHLDLLHPNRRLFRGAVDGHKLTTLEVGLLGFERQADCPSWEVPARYFQFQRSGDPTPILPVLRHNAWDILSLVALAAHLAGVCEGESLQAARAAEYAGDFDRASGLFAAVLDRECTRAERLEAIEHAARCHQKLGRHAEAARFWQLLIDEPRSRRLLPYVELAKYAEHRANDVAEAFILVEQALEMVRRGLVRPGATRGETGFESLQHRRDRLQAKLARA